MWQALGVRSAQDAVWRIGLLSNKPLLGAVVLTFGLQLAVVYVPVLQHVFQTTALSGVDLGIGIVVSSLVLLLVELEKWLTRDRAV
jgi:Ca2+-transporting ATPase